MFSPLDGVGEDAATGSAAGPLACHLGRHGVVPWGERDRDRAGHGDRPALDALRAGDRLRRHDREGRGGRLRGHRRARRVQGSLEPLTRRSAESPARSGRRDAASSVDADMPPYRRPLASLPRIHPARAGDEDSITSVASSQDTASMSGSSGASERQKRPPSVERCSRLRAAKRIRSGSAGSTATSKPGGSPPPASLPGRAGVARDERAAAGGRRARRRSRLRPRRPRRRGSSSSTLLVVDGLVDLAEDGFGLDVDLEDAVDRPHRGRSRGRRRGQLEHACGRRRRVARGRERAGARPHAPRRTPARKASPAPVGLSVSMRRTGIALADAAAISTRARRMPCVSSSSGTPSLMTLLLAAERLDLLLVQLQRRHVPEDGRIEVGVEHERTGLGTSNERLPVEREPAVAGEHGEHVGREVGARQSAHLHPVGPADGARVLRASRASPGRRSTSPAPRRGSGSRRSSCCGAASHVHWTPSAASGATSARRSDSARARDDARAAAEQPQRTGGVIRRAADARRAAGDRVASEMFPITATPRTAANSRTGASPSVATASPSATETAKLGSVAPMPRPAPLAERVGPPGAARRDAATGRARTRRSRRAIIPQRHRWAAEDVLLAVVRAGREPVREQDAEERHEEGAQHQQEALVREQVDRQRADRRDDADDGHERALRQLAARGSGSRRRRVRVRERLVGLVDRHGEQREHRAEPAGGDRDRQARPGR